MRWLAFAAFLAFAGSTHASTPGEPCQRGHGVKAGESAPCSGLLLPKADVVKAATCLKVSLPRCSAEIHKAQANFVARQADLQRKLDAQIVRATLLDQRLIEVAKTAPPERAWYVHPAFTAVVGFGVGIGVTVLVIYVTR